MKYRVWSVTAIVLGIGAALLVWHLLSPNPNQPTPLLPRERASRAAVFDEPPIANPFGIGDAVPVELTDETFHRMIEEFSEPDGHFMYENYLSNERSYQDPIPSLIKIAKPGGIYLGVGPEQNFTYIAAL